MRFRKVASVGPLRCADLNGDWHFTVNPWWTISACRATIHAAAALRQAGGTFVLYDLIMLGVVVACLIAIHIAFDALQRRGTPHLLCLMGRELAVFVGPTGVARMARMKNDSTEPIELKYTGPDWEGKKNAGENDKKNFDCPYTRSRVRLLRIGTTRGDDGGEPSVLQRSCLARLLGYHSRL